MGQSLGELYAELALKTDKLQKGIRESNRSLAKLEQDIDKTVESINAKLAAIGTALSASVTLPLTLLGKGAVDTFRNFEQSMRNTYSVMSATASEMEALKQKAEKMGASTRFSASQAADALYSLGSAGQTAAQAMNSLDGVLQLAGATGSDLAFTSSTIASTLSQFNLSAEKSGHIADVFSLAISKSQANMTKLSYSMKYVGPVAAGLGVSLETSTAALMRLYNTGFGGEQAGTILRSGLQKLASGTDDVKKKLEALGVSYDEVNPKTNNLADIIERLKNANIDVAKSSDLFGEAAAAGMQALIEGGGDAIRTMDGLLQASDGAAKKMQDIQNDSSANTQAELSSAFEAVLITLTSNIIPAVDMFAKGITRVLQAVNELPVGVQTSGTAFAALAAAAGPLLLVAVGIKKIQAEMVQLNLVMSANPIIAWGAAIAAAGAIALGIIAQVKKAHEDYIHGAKRSVEEVKKLKEDALKQGNEGRKIQSLFDEYNTLKNKTQRTADEQERYNNLLKELQTIVPGATEALDAQGQKVIQNEQAISEAIRKRIESEKILNNLALIKAKSNVAHAQSVLASQGTKLPQQQAALEKAIAKMEQAANSYSKAQYLKSEYDLALLENRKEEAARIYNTLKNYADKARLAGEISLTRWDTTSIVQAFETVKTKAENTAESARAAFEKTAAAIQENEQAQRELNEAIEKQHALETAENNLNTTAPKKKHDEELARLAKEWEAEKKIIDEKNRYAQKMGESFSVPQERIKFLQAKLKELIAIKPEDIDTIFTLDSKGLQQYFDAIAQEQAKLEKGKRHKSTGAKDKDTSYQAQIAELDKFYQEKLAKAKEYGKDSAAIEKEYLNERKKLIDQFVKQVQEAEKKRKENEGLSDAALLEKAKNTKTSENSGVTLADEYIKTARLGLGAFEKYKEQMQEVRNELEKVQKEIQTTQSMLESGKDASGNALSDSDKADVKQYLQDMQDKAAALRLELAGAKVSLSDIQSTLGNLENAGKSEFQLKLINIKKERERIQQVLEAARVANKITEQEKQALEKKADAQEAKAKKQAAADMANFYVQGVMNIGQTLANVIAGAIENGGLDGLSALQAGGQILGQISNMVQDPVTKAVLGGISAAVGIATTIIGAVNKRNQKEIEDFNNAQKEKLKQWEAYVEKVASGLAERTTNLLSAGFHKPKDIFQDMDYQREQKRYQNFLNDIEKKNATLMRGTTWQTTSGWLIKRAETHYGKEAYKIKDLYAQLNMLDEKNGFEKYLNQYADNLRLLKGYSNETREFWKRWGKRDLDVEHGVTQELDSLRQKGSDKIKKEINQKIKESIEQAAKEEGIDIKALTGLGKFAGSFDTALAEYIRTKDMKAFKNAIKENLKKAIIDKVVTNTITSRLQKLFTEYEHATDKEAALNKIMQEGTSIAEEASETAEKMAGSLGLGSDALAKQREEWQKIGEAISSSLSSALGEAAYNADWGSFKKSFAAEMKKAIIQSAMQSAGIKAKVDSIIQEILKDGKVTSEEVNGAINALKPLYDRLEKMMAEVAGTTKALEGGVEVKTQAAGTIIQQLSGADRDVLLEAIKNGFSTINQSIDLKDATIQHLAATQIIINAVTFNSYNGTVNIYADKAISLQDLVQEITKEMIARG